MLLLLPPLLRHQCKRDCAVCTISYVHLHSAAGCLSTPRPAACRGLMFLRQEQVLTAVLTQMPLAACTAHLHTGHEGNGQVRQFTHSTYKQQGNCLLAYCLYCLLAELMNQKSWPLRAEACRWGSKHLAWHALYLVMLADACKLCPTLERCVEGGPTRAALKLGAAGKER